MVLLCPEMFLSVELVEKQRPERPHLLSPHSPMSPRILLTGVLTILAVLSLSSGTEYVRRGSDITNYSMICHDTDTVLDLYRVCGDEESKLLELWCDTMWSHNLYKPRLHLNTSSGCWTLTGAEKSDSCRYNLWLHKSSGSSHHFTDITVLDPVLITNITSNSSRLGEDIAVSVHFSGEETTVTWEVDGGRVPDRYHVIDDNRMLIIQRAGRGDSGRRLSVRITNPVSNETREYQLQITDPEYSRLRFPAVLVGTLFPLLIFLIVLLVKSTKKMKLRALMII